MTRLKTSESLFLKLRPKKCAHKMPGHLGSVEIELSETICAEVWAILWTQQFRNCPETIFLKSRSFFGFGSAPQMKFSCLPVSTKNSLENIRCLFHLHSSSCLVVSQKVSQEATSSKWCSSSPKLWPLPHKLAASWAHSSIRAQAFCGHILLSISEKVLSAVFKRVVGY